MRLDETTKTALNVLLAVAFPADVYFDIDGEGNVNAQCATQDQVRRARVSFGGGVVWEKTYSEGCGWWEYRASVPQGFKVYLYACKEGPASCRAIEEEVEVEEKVPVQYETRTVKKKVIRWDCSGGTEAQE
jgi:hypothetical protein